jgi:hypothetical protein
MLLLLLLYWGGARMAKFAMCKESIGMHNFSITAQNPAAGRRRHTPELVADGCN